MTRKFTPPTKYPQDYKSGRFTATIVAPMPDGLGYIGFAVLSDGKEYSYIWCSDGLCAEEGDDFDLHDIPERRTLYRDFGIDGRHVIECDPSGENPTVTWEKTK